ncbi:MAG: hypothetical protein LWX07_08160 [Bacteroidetes bacterium]|nr:hypothetical protein [Bacteroidota bacterium]
MNKTALVLALVLFLLSNAFSQNTYVDKIKNYCEHLGSALSQEGNMPGT